MKSIKSVIVAAIRDAGEITILDDWDQRPPGATVVDNAMTIVFADRDSFMAALAGSPVRVTFGPDEPDGSPFPETDETAS
ncbi:MAG: hypothetical protein H0W42_12490 [Gemmatimonadaceae bacterium]|nr:hypothetical protein [Gemmatimonadaceae bacterium]